MIPSFVDTLKFTYIDFREASVEEKIIYFTTKETLFCLSVTRNDELFYPKNIFHLRKESGELSCPFCGNNPNKDTCEFLKSYKEALFHRLIKHPKIRFQFLYIPHKDE